MTKPKVDIAASIRQRLLNQSRETGQDFNRVLVRYGIERLLYRLSQSTVRDRFVLKGAMLFATWADAPFRATGDLDLLGFGDFGVQTATSAFAAICATESPEDGLVFLTDTIAIERTREDDDYQGLHVRLEATLKTTRIPILIDLGFGDVIHPAALDIEYPRLLTDLPAGSIRAYPPTTVVAEKFDAMVRFGDQATRLKDHYDIWAISRTFSFELADLASAVRLTLARRDRALPDDWPASLSDEFARRDATSQQWNAFLRRTSPSLVPPAFSELAEAVRAFMAPVRAALQRGGEVEAKRWTPEHGWQATDGG